MCLLYKDTLKACELKSHYILNLYIKQFFDKKCFH